MFGYVNANWKELDDAQKERYQSVYCGICRGIREQSGQIARLGLSYDMAFLALLLMSLYEPEERSGPNACMLHPIKKRPWVDNDCIRYAADMNVALSYYKCLDDWQDDGNRAARFMAQQLRQPYEAVEQRYPRQCEDIRRCIDELSRLEGDNCPEPDQPANAFGNLMGSLLTYRDDLWATYLRNMGFSLGRFIYLLDAAVDYRRDQKKGKYNPYIAMGQEEDWDHWEQYLILAMGKCTENYEKLPLLQDKALLDNILYSGVWVSHRRGGKEEKGGRK